MKMSEEKYETEEDAIAPMRLRGVMGFDGGVPNGLIYHPDGEHVVFPLGSTVVIKNITDNSQVFLRGHNDKVSCCALSKCGRYLASGQKTHIGFKADVIVWDVETKSLIHRLSLHKVLIQDLCFSPDGTYLATLGGRDDNKLVIWDRESGTPIRGESAGSDATNTVRFFNNSSNHLVTGGNYALQIWNFERSAHGHGGKLVHTKVALGSVKRVISCLACDESDQFVYAGTTSGDVLKVSLSAAKFRSASKAKFAKGVRCLTTYSTDRATRIIVGAGDGTLVLVADPFAPRKGKAGMIQLRDRKLSGGVTSVSKVGGRMYCGTDAGNLYSCDANSLEVELRGTSHSHSVTDVQFPAGCSDLFVTSSYGDLRLWNAHTRHELLRIKVPNLWCNCIALTPDGASIISGWEDGKIRAFGPESGKLQYVITDAHQKAVTALAITNSGSHIVSGGDDGRVRIWHRGKMIASLKEHKDSVTSIKIRADDNEVISASADGSCIIWDFHRHVRLNAFFESTMFKDVVYHPDESQLLTAGSDRKVTYWDATDANVIRVLEGSSDEINALDVDPEGLRFVSGGNDKIVKVWHYDEGYTMASGEGHSGGVNAIKISPDQSTVVSVGSEGACFIWEMPAPEATSGK